MPFFSIITVSLNAEATFKATAASLLGQEFEDWEWIIMDGGSTDGTLDIIREVAPGEARLSLTSEPDQGIYDAMNKGVQRARGAFVYFLNTDDGLADPRVLKHVEETLAAHPGVDFLYGDICEIDVEGRRGIQSSPPPGQVLDEFVCGCLPHQSCFLRRSLFAASSIGPFREDYRISADYLWMMTAVSAGSVQLHYLPRLIANYSVGGISSQLEKSLPESFRALNENAVFLEAIGERRIREIYQQNILTLRVELNKIRAELARERGKKELIQAKLATALSQQAGLKKALKMRPGGGFAGRVWHRIARWAKPRA